MLILKENLFKWGPIDGSVLLISYPMFSMFSAGEYGWPEGYVIFQNKKITWLNSMKELMVLSEKFTREHILAEEKKVKYLADWNSVTSNLYDKFRLIDQLNLSKLSVKELIAVFNQFSRVYADDYQRPTGVVEFVNFALDKWLQEILREKITDTDKFNESLAVLSAPTNLTFYREEEKDLLQILQFNKDQQKEKIKEHAKKYFWIYNSYLESKILDENFFQEELKRLSKSDYRQFYAEIINYPEKIITEKNNLIAGYGLDDWAKKIISLIEEFSILQDKRKKDNFYGDHYVDLLVGEISRRLIIPINDLKNLTYPEVESFLNSDDSFRELIAKRNNKPLVYYFLGNGEWQSLDVIEAGNIINQLSDQSLSSVGNIIQGIVGSLGQSKYFRGTVKVIRSTSDLDKINAGDVLVAAMTAPDYVVGMKSAGAVITDEGGITCHAAIICRELGIPCLVGTKMATQILKDGDVVEIHGGRGIIKIIKVKK